MIKQQQILTAAIAIALFIIGGPAAASDNGIQRYDSAIKSCTTEINGKANYSGATRVRHTVMLVKKHGGRYVFSIGTDVFTDSDEIPAREYASYCVAGGDDKLVRFRIDEESA